MHFWLVRASSASTFSRTRYQHRYSNRLIHRRLQNYMMELKLEEWMASVGYVWNPPSIGQKIVCERHGASLAFAKLLAFAVHKQQHAHAVSSNELCNYLSAQPTISREQMTTKGWFQETSTLSVEIGTIFVFDSRISYSTFSHAII